MRKLFFGFNGFVDYIFGHIRTGECNFSALLSRKWIIAKYRHGYYAGS